MIKDKQKIAARLRENYAINDEDRLKQIQKIKDDLDLNFSTDYLRDQGCDDET